MTDSASHRPAAQDPGAGVEDSSRRSGRRLTGVDVARFAAIAGMVMVHFGPTPAPDTPSGDLYGISHGRASILFALLAGVGVALLFHGRARDNPILGRGRILLRAALLLPIGLWLQSLDHGVLVILHYYALYFLFAALVVTLPDRWLITGAAAVVAVGPLIYLAGESNWPHWYEDDPTTIGDSAAKVTRDLLLAGSYPLVTWAAPILTGVWIGRRNLASVRTRWTLLGVGLTMTLVAFIPEQLVDPARNPGLADFLTTDPHSQMPFWLFGSIGSALAVLGGALILSDRFTRAAWPLVAAGQLALSIYVGHLFLLHFDADLVEREAVGAASLSVAVFMLAMVVVCTLWRSVFSRGPLEAVLGAPWWVVEQLTGRGEPSRQGRATVGDHRNP